MIRRQTRAAAWKHGFEAGAGGSQYFSPTFLRGKPRQTLTLLVENEASTLHNITFPASGVLAFSCKFHGPLGMNGQLLAGDTPPSGVR